MKTPRWSAIMVALALAVAAGGCAKKATPSVTPETTTQAVEAPRPAEPAPMIAAEPFPAQPVQSSPVLEPSIDDLNRSGVLKTVYFGYDSNDIDGSASTTLQGNADWLRGHPRYNVEISGHCDERGSIGYNVALGDRRATAVKSYLVSLGADGSKLMAISYGEEKPADPGHGEVAYGRNRRAEFTIKP